jgi:hypothetical protein
VCREALEKCLQYILHKELKLVDIEKVSVRLIAFSRFAASELT